MDAGASRRNHRHGPLRRPLLAFVLVIALVKGHASVAYYEAVSQIIPVAIIALAIELRYFSPSRQLPKPLKARFRHPESSGRVALSVTAAGLAAGACALIAAILLPSSGGEVTPPG
jgi:hypothetical protein